MQQTTRSKGRSSSGASTAEAVFSLATATLLMGMAQFHGNSRSRLPSRESSETAHKSACTERREGKQVQTDAPKGAKFLKSFQ